MNIIYKDDCIAVVEKAFGEISERSENPETGTAYTPDLLRCALEGEGESGAVFTVHRLDRTTAGLMVYARTKKAAAELSRQLQEGTLEKIYIAAVHGKPENTRGEMRDFLFFDRRKGKSFAVEKRRNGTKEALLRYEWLESRETHWGEISLVRVWLMTGRTHQIRVQFASRGMPLLGDGKYGSRANFKGCSLLSAELRLKHPVTGVEKQFRTEQKLGVTG